MDALFQRRRFPRQLAGLLALLPWLVRANQGPAIEFDYVPPFGSFNDLTGLVRDADPAAHHVAVYIYVIGGWWTKPNGVTPLALIQSNGAWSCDITTGGVDEQATQITAFLVRTNYSPPALLGTNQLPASLLSNAVAQVTVTRDDPAVRKINFSGLEWWVKADTNQLGPGPNYFSGGTNNAWLDASNRLHLRITHTNGQWRCAEVVTKKTFGYGQYRFQLESTVDNLDPNAVLGMFTWSDDEAFAHREIDFEFSRWGNAADTNHAQFVVQPYDLADHLVRYPMPTGQVASTHVFEWKTNRVNFQSAHGWQTTNSLLTNLIAQWAYTNAVPSSGDENVRLNLWLFQGAAPQNGQEAEIIVRDFQFVPADSDGDGMADTWEIRHGFNPNDPTDAAADADGDGQSNLAEFLAGTDPRDARSFFSVRDAQQSGGTIVVGFDAVVGQPYRMGYRDNLSGGGWTAWTNVPMPAFNRRLFVTNLAPPGTPARFFQVTTP